MIIIHW